MRYLFLIIISIFSISIYTQNHRGRVKIQDGTLVTDQGTLLRGAFVSTDNSDYIPSENEIAYIKELGLNCIHLYAECAVLSDSAGQKYKAIDSIVNMTERKSLYLVITIGGCGDEGNLDSSFVNAFWNFYAPRYKDKTHVVYEIMNEPFAWSAPYDSLTLLNERNAYNIIRTHAPETHVLFMSYSWPVNADGVIKDINQLGDINWSNASIASHAYQVASEELRPFIKTIMDSGYAIIFTEFESIGNKYINAAFTRVFENECVSYLHFIPLHKLIREPSLFKLPVESSEIRWNPDFGTWPNNLTEINYKNPYQKYEAGFYDEGLGVKSHFLETSIGYINNEDYVGYYNFDFEDGPDSLLFECSAGNLQVSSGGIELIFDSINGISVGIYPITHTESWEDYVTFRFPISVPIKGINKFYFRFRGDHSWDLMNLKSFTFKRSDTTFNSVLSFQEIQRFQIFPNPAIDNITVQLDENSIIEIYNIQGSLLLRQQICAEKNNFSIAGLSSGSYIIKILNDKMVYTEKIIID